MFSFPTREHLLTSPTCLNLPEYDGGIGTLETWISLSDTDLMTVRSFPVHLSRLGHRPASVGKEGVGTRELFLLLEGRAFFSYPKNLLLKPLVSVSKGSGTPSCVPSRRQRGSSVYVN